MPNHARNLFHWWSGLGFLALAKLKHDAVGYRSPRPFALDDAERCIAYDVAVVDAWLAVLRQYTGEAEPLAGRTVLELGPGADLGVAGYLLGLGAARWVGLDANPLLAAVPDGFYEPLLRRLAGRYSEAGLAALREELRLAHAGRSERVLWRHLPGFTLTGAIAPASADLVVSQAAFEHFDDVPRTFAELSPLVRPGGVLVAEVDLQTHSRWIRTRDPLNLYRYGDPLYRAFRFRGIPNRLRPRDYERALAATGWRDIVITRKGVLGESQLEAVRAHLHPRYRGDDADMRSLSIVIRARRDGA